ISKKAHSVGSVLIAVALVISIFSIGFYTEGNNSIVKNDENEITGNAVGLESVTGFVINQVGCWDSSSTSASLVPQQQGKSYFCIKANPNGYLEKIDYNINNQGGIIPSPTFYAKSGDQTWSNTPPAVSASASTSPKPPAFNPQNPNQFIVDMENWKKAVEAEAQKKALDVEVKKVDQAAQAWIKNPTSTAAEENYKKEVLRFQLSRDPSEAINSLDSQDAKTKDIARQVVIAKIDKPEFRSALESSSNPEAQKLSQRVQIAEAIKPFNAKIDYNTGEIIDKTGRKGWGLTSQGLIDPNAKKPETPKEESDTAKKLTNIAYEQYINQESAETLTQNPDGSLTDEKGRIVKLSFSVIEKKWTVSSRTSKSNIKSDEEKPKTLKLVKDVTMEEGKDSQIPIYQDSNGKLYNFEGKPLSDGTKIIKETKIGEIRAKLVFEVEKGKLPQNPSEAFIDNKRVPTLVYNDLVSLVKTAGKDAKVEGSLAEGLTIKNKDDKDIGRAISVTDEEGITNGVKIESDFTDLGPLKAKTTSEDGKITIEEKKKIIEKDTGQKDAEGKPVKEKIIEVESWVKVDKNSNEKSVREFITENGKQTEYYTDVTTDLQKGEPKKSTLVHSLGRYIIEYRKDGVYVNDEKYEIFIANIKDIRLLELLGEKRYLHTQYTSRQFFSQLESILTDFSGLGYYATLFFDDADLDAWRENVDKTFATLYLGTEYWTSDICAVATDIDRSSQGVAYVDTKSGLAAVAAHIEASRSEQIIGPGKEDNMTG
ncbi:MAG: hypothetical protein HY361_01445, partial [Candidatus Aenigmarchaeota archaeon]|nr:hypothetical protein [Candidatus Aenigmarchaeota archaeon]